ncbi:MAG: RimK family alpha-L-glutamate ligase [Bacteroidales bacterium]|nr:RimK family alpha-L-glutamate ligase [Bacteroidales bacterium]
MNLALLSGGTGWHIQDLMRAAQALGQHADVIDFRTVSAGAPAPHPGRVPLNGYDVAIVRTMPAGSLEQVVLRMDLLHAASFAGVKVLNPPRAVETCVDKYLTNVRLAKSGVSVPLTIACQKSDDAMIAFEELGGDVVVKPLFGAEGRGIVRVNDRELAWRTFHAIEQTGGVIYVQQYIAHPGWDLRIFIIAGSVIGAMKRTATQGWRTNVAQGGIAEKVEPSHNERRLAVWAADVVGAPVAGVDLLPGPNGEWFVLEVNAVPGWKALSQVCEVDVAKAIVRYAVEEYRA